MRFTPRACYHELDSTIRDWTTCSQLFSLDIIEIVQDGQIRSRDLLLTGTSHHRWSAFHFPWGRSKGSSLKGQRLSAAGRGRQQGLQGYITGPLGGGVAALCHL